MYWLPTRSLAASLLITSATSQTTSNVTCSDLDNLLRYNASTTREIPALRINGTRESEQFFSVENDTSQTWTLSNRVKSTPVPHSNDIFGDSVILLNTRDSNLTAIGSYHQIIRPQIGLSNPRSYEWVRTVMQRSLQETGDCKATLREECIASLKALYANEAVGQMMRGTCMHTNNTVPKDCDGLGRPAYSFRKKFSLSLYGPH
jgi:hypothetical protein